MMTVDARKGGFRHCIQLFFFQADDGIRVGHVTGVQTCALPISRKSTVSLVRNHEPVYRMVTSLEFRRVLFRGMERSFQPDHAHGFSGEVQYQLTGRRGVTPWTLRIAERHAEARPGVASRPAVTIRMPVARFARLAAGEADPGQVFLEGGT